MHKPFSKYEKAKYLTHNWNEQYPNPNQVCMICNLNEMKCNITILKYSSDIMF